MPLDLQNDFELFDGLETVTVIQAGTAKRQTINSALQFGVTVRDAVGSDGTYRQGDVKWNLPAAQCGVFEPSTGDFIEESKGVMWSVGTVELLTLRTRHQCWCKRCDLRAETSVELKIYKPQYVKDATGAAVTNRQLWKVVRGHINELASEIEVESGRRKVKITHQIFITEPIDVQSGMLVKDETGKAWHVNRVTDKGNMGMATVLDVETSRTPITD